MTDPEAIRGAVHSIITKGDDTIIEYVIGIMEDEHFEFGEDGEDAFDAVGHFLVDGGCCETEDGARDICKHLAEKLSGEKEAAGPSIRALDTGPVQLAVGADTRELLYEKESGMHMIQTPFGDLPTITDKDKAKIERKKKQEELAARAAFEAHKISADKAAHGRAPTIVRNLGGGGSKDVHLDNFSVSNGGKELIEDATVTLAFGRRYGLVGRNGTGKSTLLRAMAGYEIPGIPANCQILHVEQEIVGDDTTVIGSVLACDTERSELLEQEEEILSQLNKDRKDMQGSAEAAPAAEVSSEEAALTIKLTKIYERLESIDAYGADSRASLILAGLSFSPDEMKRATKTFSGGWRMRIALARALFVEPDLLLLDEPTNHLDLHAVLWLEDYLVKWPKTLMVVSHAREFLNATCTDILHLHSQKVTTYKGDYDTFQRTMTEMLKNKRKAAEAQDVKRKHVQAFIDRFRYNANRAALVQSRIKALERMAEVEQVEVDPEYVFSFPDPGAAIAPPIIGFHDVDFNYPGGPKLFKNLNFGLDLGSRAAIVGPNGIGKSTLLNLISGQLEATVGQINRNPRVRLATFSQHHVDGLDLALTPLAIMMREYPHLKDHEVRQQLGKFGISDVLASQPLYTLSGGQKNRVAFAKLTYPKPHILLLDEPSNHLDIDAVNALIEGLAMFKGGVLMVSHDQFLIEATVDELWMCEEGKVTPFHGTFQEYKNKLRATIK